MGNLSLAFVKEADSNRLSFFVKNNMENQKQNNIKIGVYLRVSSDQQDVKMQRDEIMKEIGEKGYEFIDEYADESIKGTDDNRDELNRLLSDAQKGLFNTVLCYKIDRIAREVRLGLNILYDMEKIGGVKVMILKEPMLNTDSPGYQMLRTAMLMGAEMEYESIKQRTRSAKTAWIKANRWPSTGHVPDGYKLNKDYGLEVDEIRAPIIRRIFSLYVDDNLSVRQIRDLFNKEGIRSYKGRPWGKDTIQDKLKNPVYIGKLPVNGKKLGPIHTFICPPIISEERFNEVQGKKNDRVARSKRNIKYEYPFRPYLSCACCGHDLHSMASGRSREENFTVHYGFRKPYTEVKYKKRCSDGCGRISEIKLVEAIYSYILKVINRSTVNEIKEWLENKDRPVYDDEDRLLEFQSQLDSISDEKTRIVDLYQSGHINKQNMTRRISGVESRQKAVENKIRVVRQSQVKREEDNERLVLLDEFAQDLKDMSFWSKVRIDTEYEDPYQEKRKMAIDFLKFIKNINVNFPEKVLYITTRAPRYLDGILCYEDAPKVRMGRPGKKWYIGNNWPITVVSAN